MDEATEIFENCESNVRSYCRTFPAVFQTARGEFLYTESGREYVDFFAAAGSLNLKPALTAQVDVGFLVANLSTGALQVVDARAPDRFRGQNETIDPVGGHIPHARNRFFKDNLTADGTFKEAALLRSEFAPLFATAAQAIMQCGSGVTACHNLLALEVAGMPGAALYPGSWSEWSADPSRPVATGAELTDARPAHHPEVP